ncbi:hypothetical protein JTE90_001095 [Oedothorax gibbosus]|uniref:RING-type domain-containing protein n=1 Tax=Oedothorax gibbosus TaxID=931172 RepID=A0AAV6UKE6_9ARAC|nr:hypothetical protein JTE90_001095 [Oedothorax gibbosus]
MQRSPSRLQIVDLNPYLSCILCGGYFIDATTITECVHSFCRACIVRFLETSKYCPVCEVQVHKSRPLHYIRSDKTLQDIVYKLVPGLFHNEMKRRRELYASQPPEAIKESRDAEDRGECLDEKFIYAPDELFSLSVEYGNETTSQESSTESDDSLPKKRFLRCPAAITVSHLKKFIRMKYGIPNTYHVVLQYDDEALRDEYTLMDIAYIFLWERKGPMRFFYKIVERPPKVVKPIVDTQQSDVKTFEPVDPLTLENKTETEDLKVNVTSTSSESNVTSSTVHEIEEKYSVNNMKVKCDPGKTVMDKEDANIKREASNKHFKTEKVEKKETSVENPVLTSPSSKKEVKVTTTLKFLPTSSSKCSSFESKPAVMTVAPLTKPSTSLATTTSTTASPGTITHGLYTGISIKKSPPNTLPPFTIVSSHLLPPRVPPLKLSPPRFSKIETCLKQMTPKETSSKKSSSHCKKSKSSKSSLDKLESKVAQLKSACIKSIAPLVISVSHETPKVDISRKTSQEASTSSSEEKPTTETPQQSKAEPPKEEPSTSAPETTNPNQEDLKFNLDDDKIDLDNDLFEGPLVIAEPDPLPKDESEDSTDDKPMDTATPKVLEEDPEDEEIDVVDDGEADSGRGSDVSSRAEARSLSGDDELGSPESVPKTPESDHPQPISIPKPPVKLESSSLEPVAKISKCNGVTSNPPATTSSKSSSSECGGALDLSSGNRKRSHEGDLTQTHRSKPVANPAVLDKSRQTPCRSPELQSFKGMSSPVLPINPYKIKPPSEGSNGRSNFKCNRGSNLTVINADSNGNIPKIVIRKLGPRPPERGRHERFHHHHSPHHHHHQRMYTNNLESKCVFPNKTKLLG